VNTARLAFIAWCLCAVSAQAEAPTDLRVALVIGNAGYSAAPLANPANDARAMSRALKSMGFSVIEVRDGNRSQMQAAIAEMHDALKGKSGVGMFYYAGHGMQLDWHNYMVPVDAKIGGPSDVAAQTVDLQSVVDAFKSAGNRINIVVLDACRDNPFAQTASAKGLAPLDAPPGTLLAYATAPGNVADDGDATSANGTYTGYLVQEIVRPNARIEDVFKRVRLQVRRQSQGRQIPWESTSLEEDFYFDTGKKSEVLPERDQQAAFAAEKADWERIKDSKSPDDFYAYLQRYPNGLISERAQFQLEQLQKAAIVAQPGVDGLTALSPSKARYAVGDHFVYRAIDFYGKELPPRDLQVTAIDDDRIIINGGREVWDLMGNQVTNALGTRSPAKMWFPTELVLGKRWRSAYTIRYASGANPVSLYWDFHVAALEDISVPAGTFRAYRVEGTSWTSNGNYQSETFWIDPTDFLMIKDIYASRRGGAVQASSQWDLISATRSNMPTQ
jgi:uncharacterized caspase-like protein